MYRALPHCGFFVLLSFFETSRGADYKFSADALCPIVVFFAKLSFFLEVLVSWGAGRINSNRTPCPISVFFAKLSFFQKKAEGFLMRGIYGRI